MQGAGGRGWLVALGLVLPLSASLGAGSSRGIGLFHLHRSRRPQSPSFRAQQGPHRACVIGGSWAVGPQPPGPPPVCSPCPQHCSGPVLVEGVRGGIDGAAPSLSLWVVGLPERGSAGHLSCRFRSIVTGLGCRQHYQPGVPALLSSSPHRRPRGPEPPHRAPGGTGALSWAAPRALVDCAQQGGGGVLRKKLVELGWMAGGEEI